MGQNQQKDSKGQPVKRAVVHGRGAMRTNTISDALVQPTTHRQLHQNPTVASNNANTTADQRATTTSPAGGTPRDKGDPQQAPPPAAPTAAGATTAAEPDDNPPKVLVQQTPVVLRYRDPQDLARLFEQKKRIEVLYRPANTTEPGAVPWVTLPMTQSDDNFYAIASLAAGEHEFRFQIDGHVRVDASQATQKTLEGDLTNVMFVNPLLLTTGDDDDIVDDGEAWGTDMPKWDETRKYPPQLPAHLRYTPLNTPPTQVRCVDGELSNNSAQLDSEHLPLPLTVTINHVYFQRRADHVVVGMTSRYNNKYTTVAYYKHLPSALSNIPDGSIPIGGGRDV